MHNKAKSEQCLAVTSFKRVAVFQRSLKLKGKKLETNSLTKIINVHIRRMKIFTCRRILQIKMRH